MNTATLALAAPWVALVLIVAAVVVAMSVLGARSLLHMCLATAAMFALGAAAIAVRSGDGAIALAAFGVGLAPLLLMSGLLLSTRAVRKRGPGTLVMLIAAGAGAAVIGVAAPELAAAPARSAPDGPIGVWLAALVFVAAIACVGLLGFGERGALDGSSARFDR